MPSFQYKEITKDGKTRTGEMVVDTKQDVIHMLKNKGSTIISIEEIDEKRKSITGQGLFAPKVKTKDIYIFCKQMHTMLSAGMPLLSAITVLENQSDNPTLRQIFMEMQVDLQKGHIFSESMKKHKEFPILLVNMIEAGELTGNLDIVLEKMADHYEKENKINAKIKGAMVYPIILALLSVGVIIFILTGLMPMFVGMFRDAGVQLPLITQILIGMSDFLVGYWYIVIIGIIALILFIRYTLQTPSGKKNWDRMCMKMPAIKKPIQMIYTSRFTRTLSTLLGSGISILEAFRSAAKITNNQVIIDSIDEASDSIKKGEPVSATLDRYHLFPSMMISMISIGEESGNIEGMLGKTADYYDQELDEAISKLVSLLEPALIIVMGIFVGFSVIAILLPMFDLSSTIK